MKVSKLLRLFKSGINLLFSKTSPTIKTKSLSVPRPLCLELWEAVIDQVQRLPDRRASLRACSLTCKAWLPRSRHYLFMFIYLHRYNKTRFIRLLSVSSYQPSAYFHTLRIHGGQSRNKRKARWINKVLPALASDLVNIKDLGLDDLDWRVLNKASRAALLSGFQSVETLLIRGVTFTSFSQLATLAASFPVLRNLGCEDIYGVEQGPPPSAVRLPARLEVLRLGAFTQGAFVEWFLAQDPIPDIAKLILAHPAEEAPHIACLLKGLGPRLQHLVFSLTSMDAKGTAAVALKKYINIGFNTNLRSIHLNDTMMNNPYGVDFDWVPMILGQITSVKMEEAYFTFSVDVLEDLDDLDWDQVDLMLAQTERLPNLARVRMVLVDKEKKPAAEYVRTRLPVLQSRGLLHFE